MQSIDKSLFNKISDDQKSSEFIARPVVTYWSDAWRRFKKNKLALISLIILIVLTVMVIIGPMLTPYEFNQMVGAKNQTPNAQFWFGTDNLGRDIFTRLWRGGRVSIIIGIAGALISTVIGSVYGAISAYFGGKVDTIMMRIVEILISIPYLSLIHI